MMNTATLRAAMVIAAAMLASGLAQAQQKPLAKVTIIAATPILDVTYSQLNLPITLGYWRDEGFDVEVHTAPGSLQSMQQLAGGNAQFATGSASAVIQTAAKGNLPIRVSLSYSASDWAIAVEENGPIKTAADFKGKTIGIVALSSGGVAFLNGLFAANGMDPKRDVELVPVGVGSTAVQALQSGRVQGLMYWGSMLANFENAGLKLRRIVGDDWHTYPEYSLATMETVAAKDPAMAIGIARGSLKAMVFATANPECAVKLHHAKFPATAPTGIDAATLDRWDLHSLQAQLASMADAYAQFGGGKVLGRFDPAAWNRLAKFMAATGQIDGAFQAETLAIGIPDYYAKINDFDKEAVRATAMACKY
jgi:NitT/TauT family transport system substrate-binding protein